MMFQREEKIRVNARIPKNLYDWVCSEYDNTSLAINEGLEKLRETICIYTHFQCNKKIVKVKYIHRKVD